MSGSVRIEREGNVAVVVIDNPPVNASSHPVREGLLAAIREIDADPGLTAAVIIGAGKTFVAGADIREFDQPLADPQMPAVVAAVIESSKPFVAALHGNALGGGFELALACDARLAAPGTNVGLPEVALGMIPGAGGTQHLPRLIGIAAAIEMICSARRIKAEEALPMGLIDHIAEVDLRTAAVEDALAVRGCKRRLRDLPIPRESAETVEAAAQAALARGENAPQVIAALEAIRSSSTMPYPEAMAREREVFQVLRNSDNARALRQKFFAERAAKKP